MRANPYLTFNGNCKAAFELYAKVLGGTPEIMTYGQSPAAEQTPKEQHDRVLHAHLKAGDVVLMGSDAPPQFFSQPQGFSVAIGGVTPEEAERIFRALSEGGMVKMPIAETFWAARFGMCVDRFGTPWIVNGGEKM